MKKAFQIIAFLLFTKFGAIGQVPLKNVVEHFTNTKCSFCASRNPGLYNNISTIGNINYVSFHPSSPYSACLLSQQNKDDNDNRTKYYGIFGATPRIVVNGNVVTASANYSTPSTITDYLDDFTPYSIKVKSVSNFQNLINVQIIIKTESIPTEPEAKLYVSLIEDTIMYTGSNGEPIHYNVSRKSVFTPEGVIVSLPANIGDSVMYEATVSINNLWNINRIKALAILQKSNDKQVLQSEMSGYLSLAPTLSVGNQEPIKGTLNIFPNPSGQRINIATDAAYHQIIITSINGSTVSVFPKSDSIDVSYLTPGLYTLTLYDKNKRIIESAKFIKESN